MKKNKKDPQSSETNKKTLKSYFKNFFSVIFKFVSWFLVALIVIFFIFFIYINLPVKENNSDAKIGVTFSSRYASDIGLDWKNNFTAMLDELKIRDIRIPVYWDLVEKNQGEYDFADLDWQLDEARKRDANVILVMGQKVPRWPECFIPKWVGDDENFKKERLLALEEQIINRYKDGHPEIKRWQVENEPFLDFGICPLMDPSLLDSEIAKVKSLDQSKPIVVTDSGELSLWVKAAKRADVFGTTMYREVYSAKMGHWRYPIGPNFFKLKQKFIKLFANQNNAIVIELQGEPWVQGWTVHAPIDVQLASMNADILADNVSFAKKTGMKEIYIWGVEWWYWMKTTQNNPTLWEQAKSLVENH